ncbi:tail fiber assembly protein [Erwinia aphidicola]|uniref:tail fiber assembly protein n=1 Tax=Erwinia aphidicola TaxID=68334 RepID=UPI003016562D
MNTTKWKLYKPADTDESVLYLQDENGADWYESQKDFASKRVKVVYDDSGVIRAFSYDVSELFPLDLYVAELARKPAQLAIDGRWIFDGEKALERTLTQEEQQAAAEAEKASLARKAAEAIAPLQDAADLGMATDEESELLLAWKKYRVLLNRVDTSRADNVDWPEVPGDVA